MKAAVSALSRLLSQWPPGHTDVYMYVFPVQSVPQYFVVWQNADNIVTHMLAYPTTPIQQLPRRGDILSFICIS